MPLADICFYAKFLWWWNSHHVHNVQKNQSFSSVVPHIDPGLTQHSGLIVFFWEWIMERRDFYSSKLSFWLDTKIVCIHILSLSILLLWGLKWVWYGRANLTLWIDLPEGTPLCLKATLTSAPGTSAWWLDSQSL